MRRLAILFVCLGAAITAIAQSGVIHGSGDPRTISPQPNCGQSRFYVDDSTQQMYDARVGSPCTWEPQSNSLPASTLIAYYDFSEGAGTTVHDVAPNASGANNWTITSGTPAATPAPQWIPGVNGQGAGLAMGSDPNTTYGLSASGGSACETLPVNQSQARTVIVQFTIPFQSPNQTFSTAWNYQNILGASTTPAGILFVPYSSGPLVRDIAQGNYLWTNDMYFGTHTVAFVLSASGQSHLYIDGVESSSYTAQGSSVVLPAATSKWVLGCNTASNTQWGLGTSNSTITAAVYVHNLAFYAGELNATQVAQASAYFRDNLALRRAYSSSFIPIETLKNTVVCSGDSTTMGTRNDGSTPYQPYCTCLTTSSCYGTAYTTVIPNFNQTGWSARSYGLPAGGGQSIYTQQPGREGRTRGWSDFAHINLIWVGINGLASNQAAPCNVIKNAALLGYDPWVLTLYSLSNVVATDQGARDAYNYTILQTAKACGAVGVINLADDSNIGADGKNGTAPYWSTGGVHMQGNGYAYVASIVDRVLQSYYYTTPDLWKSIVAAGASTLNGFDRYVIADNTAGAQTFTMPDCIGATGMLYKIRVKGANGTTLSAASVAGQTEQVEGGASTALTTGTYTFEVMTNATAATAPGGCNYVRVQ